MDRIELFAGDNAVHKMKLTYESEDVGKATVEVGGDGGKSKTYVFGKDDYIMNISGVYGSVINNLRITTSKSYIHVARDGAGQPFVWSVPSGFFTVALQGKGDSKGLHSLTVTAARLKAAIWVPSA